VEHLECFKKYRLSLYSTREEHSCNRDVVFSGCFLKPDSGVDGLDREAAFDPGIMQHMY
jgi:hypothetical protein